MKLLLLLFLLFCQDTDKLINDLNDDNVTVRQNATDQLITHEMDLSRFKIIAATTSSAEVKWRMEKIVKCIEANQKFRSMTKLAPLVTLKFEGTLGDLFTKLAELTGEDLDVRAFGDNKVKIDFTNAPLFKVLDEACKQTGFDWEVIHRDSTGNTTDQFLNSPLINCTSVIDVCGLGMSDKTPSYTGSGFKMQVVATSFSINNLFGNGLVTELNVQYRFAQEPSLKFAVGPKIVYTKIVTDNGTELLNRGTLARYMMVHAPPTTKSVSVKGKATYRFPMKTETITLNGIDILKPNQNGNEVTMSFADHPEIEVAMSASNSIEVRFSGPDNVFKERFTGKYAIAKKDGTVILSSGPNGASSGYISVYDSRMQLYVYGTPSGDDAISSITLEYITEYRDISFDFAIDNIPLY